MTDFSYDTGNGNDEAYRKAALVESLSQQVRSGPPPAPMTPDVQLTAMAKWEQVKTLPIFMFLGLIGMGALFSQGGLGANFPTCGGLALLGVPLLVSMIKLNQAHREAFVENEVTKGLAREAAEKKYCDTYCD